MMTRAVRDHLADGLDRQPVAVLLEDLGQLVAHPAARGVDVLEGAAEAGTLHKTGASAPAVHDKHNEHNLPPPQTNNSIEISDIFNS